MYELAVQRSEAPIIFSCRFRHGSNPSVKYIIPSFIVLIFSHIQCLQKNNLVKANSTVTTTFLTSAFCGGFSNDQVSNKVVQFDGIKWRKLPSMKSVRCGSAAMFHKGTGHNTCFVYFLWVHV